jgi:hypothetical protein
MMNPASRGKGELNGAGVFLAIEEQIESGTV